TGGARFAFDDSATDRKAAIVNSPGLNDFVGTRLDRILAPFADRPAHIGLIGVWTEAKITFLAYDLRARYPHFNIAVCSALTASSSRAQHFIALDQMERLLGVTTFKSIGEFTRFLGGATVDVPLLLPRHADTPRIEIAGALELSDTDRQLIRYLFRDCRSVTLNVLDGGYSGNRVLGSQSVDLHGHAQTPHVLKIGPEAPIGRERIAFEQIESVLGNTAPRIADFADLGGRGALKYRYAAMGGGFSTSFQKLYAAGLSRAKTEKFLKTIFTEQLGRFYAAATLEHCNLLDYYGFRPELAPNVRRSVEAIYGGPALGPMLRFANGREFPNPCLFYERDLADLLPLAGGSAYFAYVHGDLNGANIVVDAHENVWLIDFFHTHRGHVLKDLIKLENDLLYIFTPIGGPADFEDALRLSDALIQVEDLGRPLPEPQTLGLRRPHLLRAYDTLRVLRSFYPDLIHDDRGPLQLFIGQMRYAMHTLIFDESDAWQKQWALYTGGLCGAQIADRLKRTGPLRVDWLDPAYAGAGRLGLTLLPGRRDYLRSLADDIAALKQQGVSHIVCLLTENEFARYGVEDLVAAYRDAGLVVRRLPILDGSVCSPDEMREMVNWLSEQIGYGAHIAIHCVGGLGRTGAVAACYLKSIGMSAEDAMAEVRRARSSRAIETAAQEDFIRAFHGTRINADEH
ncbi:MAG TPA: isochorismatase, partial [Anaerolineae bacterium]|nr:isochorismatase [Anaerolineae bacterium]